jgi:UDP-2,3-diacylglucosamine pyrophosphatase LpxH
MYNINLNGITIKSHDIYTSISGDRYIVMHGDEFDGVVRMNPYLYKLGDLGYKILTKINKFQNLIRRIMGLKEWSFSLWIKTRVKEAIKFLNNFEFLVVQEAKRQNARGIINGHVHVLADKEINGVRYLNSGTWAEFCSYIIEHPDGIIEAKYYE